MTSACSIRVRGVVQGVGFRPFVFRLARANTLAGWVLNAEEGVEMFLEGDEPGLQEFLRELKLQPPSAARITDIEVESAQPVGLDDFTIRESKRRAEPTVCISPDLPVCDACLQELFDPGDRRFGYPYINCTDCGPRYSLIERLPYDRPNTTMKDWPLDAICTDEYANPSNRRFHAQPVACPVCGPQFLLFAVGETVKGSAPSIRRAAQLLCAGSILAIKGIGGYHLACDARNGEAVASLRCRKYRKEKPFAVMVRNIEVAHELVELGLEAEQLLTSLARPIVLAKAKIALPEVAAGNGDLGVMLPYTPLHHLLFAAGAPDILVMTSGNRSSEPIAYEDEEAREKLSGIADGFLVGERAITRRVDDSIVRGGTFGPMILRRSRGYAPGAVAVLPVEHPILALGADLKNTVTLVVAGQAFVSQHIGDLTHFESLRAFRATIHDFISMYEVSWDELLVIHDAHPQYLSTIEALEMPSSATGAVQHHRAHLASVLAERQAWGKRVVGVSFDGTGYGDDGTIWGGEIFIGSISEGFKRVANLRPAALPGGDAAAELPVQAAAGFLAQLSTLPEMNTDPFYFPKRYEYARELIRKGIRILATTSVGRLFDAAAALLGFTREVTFEGQAAVWIEHIARGECLSETYPFPFVEGELDFRPLFEAVIRDRMRKGKIAEIARSFHGGIARGLCDAVAALCHGNGIDTVVLSGGVFQNELLLEDVKSLLAHEELRIWTNHAVPPNDGGISLGQAALAAFGRFDASHEFYYGDNSRQHQPAESSKGEYPRG